MTSKLRRHHHGLLTTFGAYLKQLFRARADAQTHNTGLAKVAVQCSASTFVVKIATFAKPETVSANYRTTRGFASKSYELLRRVSNSRREQIAKHQIPNSRRDQIRKLVIRNWWLRVPIRLASLNK